jgi:hypothetical protein
MLLLPAMALADPIHMHCATESWSRTLNNPAYEFTNGGGSIAFTNLNIQANPPLKPNCDYETSDITQIDATFTFSGGSFTASSAMGSSTADVIGAESNPKGPFTFNSGAATSITFNSHSNSADNVLHASLPGGGANITIGGLSVQRDITNVKLDFSGTHYYVPEPSLAATSATGAMFLISCLRLRKPASQNGV